MNCKKLQTNRTKIHGIPVEVIDIFSQLNISISKSDIEDCQRLCKSNTFVRFIN